MKGSWIWRHFATKDDWELWCIGISWWIIQFTVAFAIITALAKLVFL